ncbi:hypothetical protein [Pendulispora albinea]
MGAGRTRSDQRVDPGVGIFVRAKLEAHIAWGAELARVHVRSKEGSR